MEMIYACDPVDKRSAIVTSQSGCSNSVFITGKRELNREILRLAKKLARIKDALGVRNKLHWKNLKYRMNIKRDPIVKNKELFFEALYLGEQIHKLHKRLEIIKNKQSLAKST